jgi:hypothetical protein
MSGGNRLAGRPGYRSEAARSRMPATALTERSAVQRAAGEEAAARWWAIWEWPVSEARLSRLLAELPDDGEANRSGMPSSC